MVIKNSYFFYDEYSQLYKINTPGSWTILLDTRGVRDMSNIMALITTLFPFLDYYPSGSTQNVSHRKDHIKITDIDSIFTEYEIPAYVLGENFENKILQKNSLLPIEHNLMVNDTILVYDFTALARDIIKERSYTSISRQTLSFPFRYMAKFSNKTDTIETCTETKYYKARYLNYHICVGMPRLKS